MDLEKNNLSNSALSELSGDQSFDEKLDQVDSVSVPTTLESERLDRVVSPLERRAVEASKSVAVLREPVSRMGAWLADKLGVPQSKPLPVLQQPTGVDILSFQSQLKLDTPPKEILSALLDHMPFNQGYVLVQATEGWRLASTKGDVTVEPADMKQVDALRRRADKSQFLKAGQIPQALQERVSLLAGSQDVSLHRIDGEQPDEWMAMPFAGQGKPVGIILVKANDPPLVSTHELMQSIQPWKVAGDRALNQLFEILEQKKEAYIDELTSLPNLRDFNKKLPEILRAAEREQAPVSIMAIDIDHLKAHNSRGGWDAGNAVITTVANLLQKEFRNVNNPAGELMSDSVVRMHGDEIVCILPRCHLSDAVAKGQKNIDMIRAKASEALGVPVSITVGVASSDDLDGTLSDARDQLLKLAVDQLKDAKNEELRDQVHVQPSKAWHVIAGAFGLTEPQAMLYEQEFKAFLSRATSEHHIIKLTENEAQELLDTEQAQQLKEKLCLDNQHPEVEGKVSVPTAESLDKKISKMNSYQATAFHIKTETSSADKQAFGLEALALKGYAQKALQALEFCSDKERPEKADQLIEDLEKIHNKPNHTKHRLALIERLSQDEPLTKGLCEHLDLSANELKALWQDLAKIGRWMNLGEASSTTTAMVASARKFTRDERMIYFKENFKKTADLLKAYQLLDSESINTIEQIRHGEKQTPKSQLLDLVDQASALIQKRSHREAFQASDDAVSSRLKHNGERYGIDPQLTALIIKAVT